MRALVADAGQRRALALQVQPADAADLAVRRLGEQHQRHHVVDNQAGRQLTVALTLLARVAQHSIDQVPGTVAVSTPKVT